MTKGQTKNVPLVLLATLVVVCLATIVSVVATNPTSAQEATTEQVESAFVAEINASRRANSLVPLRITDVVQTAARKRTQRLLTGEWKHTPEKELRAVMFDAGWSKIGENLGKGYDQQLINEAWIDSPAHRKNILDPAFRWVDIDVIQDGPNFYVTTIFGAPGGDQIPLTEIENTLQKQIASARRERGLRPLQISNVGDNYVNARLEMLSTTEPGRKWTQIPVNERRQTMRSNGWTTIGEQLGQGSTPETIFESWLENNNSNPVMLHSGYALVNVKAKTRGSNVFVVALFVAPK